MNVFFYLWQKNEVFIIQVLVVAMRDNDKKQKYLDHVCWACAHVSPLLYDY